MNQQLALLAAGGCALAACQAISGLTGFEVKKGQIAGGATASSTAATRGSDASGSGGSMMSGGSSSITGGGTGTNSAGTSGVGGTNGSSGSMMSASSSSSGAGGGSCAQYAFVTASAFEGNLGGLSGADQKCAGGKPPLPLPLGQKWYAIVSNGVEPASMRIKQVGDVCLFNSGDPNNMQPVVAPMGTLWSGKLLHAIDHTAAGNPYPDQVWTGTDCSGGSCALKSTRNCLAWGSVDPTSYGIIGEANLTGNGWLDNADQDCSMSFPLYCISAP